MASEALQILNLSPIPELSEMELSTMFEQLSGVTDPNGEITDRNVEEILREAEELMESISNKPESNIYSQCDKPNNHIHKINSSSTDDRCDDCESVNDVLNLSAYSEDESKKSAVSESNKNEKDSSQTELSSRSSKSITNHIRLTLDSLKECSEKIENQTKNSPCKNEPAEVSLGNNKDFKTADEKEHEKHSFSSQASESKSVVKLPRRNINPSLDRPKIYKNPVKNLSLNESMKTLDCFERLYRGKPAKAKVDRKRLKANEKCNEKKLSCGKIVRTMNPSVHKDKNFGRYNSEIFTRKNKTYSAREFDGSSLGNTIHCTDDEISFKKCLKLLNENSNQDFTNVTAHQTDFAEKILKQCTATFSALQEDMEDLKTQLRRNAAKDMLSNWDSNLTHKFSSQENLIRALKEENSKLFKEIEEIKGQLKMAGTSDANEDPTGCRGKVEDVEKLRLEVENLRRSLITAFSESNGILRLEEQFTLLKGKYDQQIGRLEDENRNLKEVLAEQSDRTSSGSARRREVERKIKLDIGTQTEEEPGLAEDCKPKRGLIRSVSLENFRPRNPKPLTSSCENVDAATSPIRSSFSQTDKELSSVSVQCEGEVDGVEEDLGKSQSEFRKREVFKEFKRCENKENVNKKVTGKVNPVSNQGLNMWKQKKMSEHENQLMVTLRVLRSEITVKDREMKKLKNELEVLRNQMKRVTGGPARQKPERKGCHAGTQTIGMGPRTQEAYDPALFQVSRELENENEELKSKVCELEKVIIQLKDKRVHDLQILQKLHEEEIEKLASRLNTQTALTNHLHSLLTNR